MTQQLNFNTPINSSLQVGDMLYYTAPPINSITGKPLPAGEVVSIDRSVGYIEYSSSDYSMPQPTTDDFILFSKPIQIEESSLKGYYADVTFTNRSTKRAELFAVSSEIALSSK